MLSKGAIIEDIISNDVIDQLYSTLTYEAKEKVPLESLYKISLALSEQIWDYKNC